MNRHWFLLLAVLALGTAQSVAGSPCGCGQAKYVCRLVCTIKSELTYEYDMDCDPYCLLGRSDSCGKKQVCDNGCFGFHWETIWKPKCECKVRTKHTLVKVPVVKQVPSYTCVVERVCGGCNSCRVDMAATQRVLESGVMPVSLEQPVVELNETLRPLPMAERTRSVAPTAVQPPIPKLTAAETLFSK